MQITNGIVRVKELASQPPYAVPFNAMTLTTPLQRFLQRSPRCGLLIDHHQAPAPDSTPGSSAGAASMALP